MRTPGVTERASPVFPYIWMIMRRKIEIRNWERREIYGFFKDFDEPYYGITMELDCTGAYEFAKSKGISFFLYYLYLTLKAANQTEAFK